MKTIKSNTTQTTIKSGIYTLTDDTFTNAIIDYIDENENANIEIIETIDNDVESDDETGNIIRQFKINDKIVMYSFASVMTSFEYETIFNDLINVEYVNELCEMLNVEIDDVDPAIIVENDTTFSVVQSTEFDIDDEPEMLNELIKIDDENAQILC